jgi:hypothetical protein
MANVKSIEDAIKDLENQKSKLGESLALYESLVWAIEWMVEDLMYKINSGIIFE